VLRGLDLSLTVSIHRHLFGAEGYSNSFTFWSSPRSQVGQRLFKGTWFEPLKLSARLPLEVEGRRQ